MTIKYEKHLCFIALFLLSVLTACSDENPELIFNHPVIMEPVPIKKLNDTGITFIGHYPDGNGTTCNKETAAQQDCNQGRDITYNDDSDGHAGFSFTKLDASGNVLPNSTHEWSCVKDHVTGLIWEVKKGGNGNIGDEGLHDADDSYNWYNTNPETNGGAEGYADDDGAVCYGYDANDPTSYCNTKAYTTRVNAAGLCGAKNWRIPSKMELVELVNMNRFNPSIDITYFPNTKNSNYWTSSPYAVNSHDAWYVNFYGGHSYLNLRSNYDHVRLVRDEYIQ